MALTKIKEPVSIITDKELAFIDCLDTQFPELIHLFYRWHVNMNVLAKTKKYFLRPVKEANRTVKKHPFF